LDGNSPWAHPAVWNAPNTKGVNGQLIDWNIVRLAHDITTGKDNITLLGLISEYKTLRVTDPTAPQNEYNWGIGLRLTHYLYLDGKIDLVGESQLLQDEGSILEEKSLGA